MPVKFDRVDLDFILRQIQMAEAGQPPVSPHLAFGLRQLQGTNNNTSTGLGGNASTFGAADQARATPALRGMRAAGDTGYRSSVQDSRERHQRTLFAR